MPISGILSILFFSSYFGILFFFARMLFWQKYSTKYVWEPNYERIAEFKKTLPTIQRKLPYISLLIPARDESLIIRRTIDHYLNINYPRNKFEVIIITDSKERLIPGFRTNPKTTQEEVEKAINDYQSLAPDFQLKHAEVPIDFDGEFPGELTGVEQKSTKARALNWAMSSLDKKTKICGFFDADAHPNPECLTYIAADHLEDPESAIWQGPIYQVRNFYQMGMFSRIGGLYKSYCHEYYLPIILQQIPFMGGTNMFVATDILKKIHGFNRHSLTEDLDLGVRMYLEKYTTPPHFLTCPISEQTPPTISTFFKQRLRWASGHLQTLHYLKNLLPAEKKPDKKAVIKKLIRQLTYYGPQDWVLYMFFAFISLMYTLFWILVLFFPDLNIYNAQNLLSIEAVAWLIRLFPLYLLFKYQKYFRPPQSQEQAMIIYILYFVYSIVLMPFIIWLYTAPYVWSMVLNVFNKLPTEWIKTKRTQE